MDINSLLPDLFKNSRPAMSEAKMGLLLPTELSNSSTSQDSCFDANDDEQQTTGKRVYYCQRCLNHGLREKRKNHKQDCRYRVCQCEKCCMVDQRRELNTRMHQIQEEEESGMRSANSKTKTKERIPNCQHCAQHNKQNRLKGHKRACPYKACPCGKCKVVKERQALMAAQIKLRRQQKKQKEGDEQIRKQDEQLRSLTDLDTHRLLSPPSMIVSQQQTTPLLLPPLPPPPSMHPLAFQLAALQNGCHSTIPTGHHHHHHHHSNSMPCLSALQTFFHQLPPLQQQSAPYMGGPFNGFMEDSLFHGSIEHNLLKSYIFGNVHPSSSAFI